LLNDLDYFTRRLPFIHWFDWVETKTAEDLSIVVRNVHVAIVNRLRALSPERELNEWFQQILAKGTGKTFAMEDNKNWLDVTRPILEAFFHARYFLEMAVKYGRELEYPPRVMPSGWAALLYLYNLR
jgi:hypothetical protein